MRGEKDRNGERGMREERKERGATENWGAREEGGGKNGRRTEEKGDGGVGEERAARNCSAAGLTGRGGR